MLFLTRRKIHRPSLEGAVAPMHRRFGSPKTRTCILFKSVTLTSICLFYLEGVGMGNLLRTWRKPHTGLFQLRKSGSSSVPDAWFNHDTHKQPSIGPLWKGVEIGQLILTWRKPRTGLFLHGRRGGPSVPEFWFTQDEQIHTLQILSGILYANYNFHVLFGKGWGNVSVSHLKETSQKTVDTWKER